MRKIVLIYVIALLISGCSGVRRMARVSPGDYKGKAGTISFQDITGQNITAKNFFIQKAEVEINSSGDSQKFLASIKYEVPGKYLISIRSRTGIEAARIYLDSDTVLGNDRINRILYYGEPHILSRRFGIPFEVLPVVLGDLVTGTATNNLDIKCPGGSFESENVVKGSRMIYTIDCGRKKLSGAENEGSYLNSISELEYGEFVETDGITVPSFIKINHIQSGTSISINLGKIERPWIGEVDFVPGNRYELRELK